MKKLIIISLMMFSCVSMLHGMDVKQSAEPKIKIQNFVKAASIKALMRDTKDTIEFAIDLALNSQEEKSNDEIKRDIIKELDNNSDLKINFIEQYVALRNQQNERNKQEDLAIFEKAELQECKISMKEQDQKTVDDAQKAWQLIIARIQSGSCCTIL